MNKINFKISARGIAIYGVYTALFLLMTFIPQIGYIKVGVISATLMAVPVAIVSIHKGIPGLIYGLVMWGLTALISEAYSPDATLGIIGWDGIFLTMTLGRLLIIIPLIPFLLISKKMKMNKFIRAFLVGLLISVSNTLIIVGLLKAYPKIGIGNFWAFLLTLSINWAIEWTVPPLVAGFTAGMSHYLATKDKNEKSQRY